MSTRDDGRPTDGRGIGPRSARGEMKTRRGGAEDGRIPGLLAALIGLLVLTMACGDSGADEAAARTGATDRDERPERVELRSVSGGEATADRPGGEATADRGSDETLSDESADEMPETVSYDEAESIYREGDYGRAADHFAAYVERRPDNPWGHYMLGLSARHAGDPGRAEAAFERALDSDPEHVKSLVNLGRTLLDLERPGEAVERLERARELDPENAGVLRVLGNAFSDLGRGEEAVQAYRDAIALDPEDAWSLNNLGLHYIRQGRHEEALPPLARATRSAPENPVFQNNLGTALEGSGHASASLEAYRAALEVDSTYEKASVSLARVEETLSGASVEEDAREEVDLEALAREFRVRPDTGRTDAARSSETEPVKAGSEEAESDSAEDEASDTPGEWRTIVDSVPELEF